MDNLKLAAIVMASIAILNQALIYSRKIEIKEEIYKSTIETKAQAVATKANLEIKHINSKRSSNEGNISIGSNTRVF